MKKAIIPLLVTLLCAGCASMSANKTITTTATNGVVTTTTVNFKGKSLFSNSVLKNVTLDSTTKTTSAVLKATGVTTEPNPESITASAEAIGNIIGAASATAAKTAVK